MSAALESSARPAARPRSGAWCYALPLLLGLLAITGRSFWIDECVTAEYVSQPTIGGWWHDLQTTDYAEAQMPFYLGYLWLWEKAFGHGEGSLRVAALPWFIVGVGLLLHVLRRSGRVGIAAAAMIAGSAFVWYYLNEARLYAMQFGAACAVAASLVALAQSTPAGDEPQLRWLRVLLASLVVLSGISIIGMLWAGAAVLMVVACVTPATLWRQVRRAPGSVLLWVAVSLALAAFYIASVARGARASSLATTNVQTILYVGYELLGFTGLGPGRDALREQGAHALGAHLPMLGLFGLLSASLAVTGVVAAWKALGTRRALWVGFALSLPTLFLLGTGVLRHFRVLGRHFTPLLVVVLLVLALGAAWWWRRGWVGRALVMAYLAVALCSSAQVRWAPRHFKDDYRRAAALGRQALEEGKRVWWAAAPQGAAYYGMPLTDQPGERRGAFAIFGQPAEVLRSLEPPELIVLTRPDIYDHQGGLAAVMGQEAYLEVTNFAGFEIWAAETKP